MSRLRKLSIKKLVLLTLAAIVVIPVTVFLIQFLYYNVYVEYFSNMGVMSSELDYHTKGEISDNYSVCFGENFEILISDNGNLETVMTFKTENESKLKSDWRDTAILSEKYIVVHCYNGQNMFRHHLNRMVGDRLYKLDKETSTANIVFEVKGSKRILYATDEYCVIYNGEENTCQWIDYKNNAIISEQKMNFNLSFWHDYCCVYNERDMVLEFYEYSTFPLITKEQDIAVIDLKQQ